MQINVKYYSLVFFNGGGSISPRGYAIVCNAGRRGSLRVDYFRDATLSRSQLMNVRPFRFRSRRIVRKSRRSRRGACRTPLLRSVRLIYRLTYIDPKRKGIT